MESWYNFRRTINGRISTALFTRLFLRENGRAVTNAKKLGQLYVHVRLDVSESICKPVHLF